MRLSEDPQIETWIRLWTLILVCCCASAVALVVAALWILNGFHGLGVGGNTMIALLLGTIGTAALAVVLMGLAFYSDASRTDEQVRDLSSRKDDRAGGAGSTRERKPR